MQKEPNHGVVLVKRLGIVLVLYSICRLLFVAFNYTYFNDLEFSELARLCTAGIRFDLSAIAYSNLAVIVFHLIPYAGRTSAGYQRFLKFLFYASNLPALFMICADFVYFRFIFKHSTADLFTLISTGDDFVNLFPRFVRDYYYLVLIYIALIALAEFLYRRVLLPKAPPNRLSGLRPHFAHFALSLILGGLTAVAARGGLQTKPISMITSALYAQAREVPIILNTPFCIIRTLKRKDLTDEIRFPPEKLASIYTPIHPARGGRMKTQNVVVIILESFAREFVGSLNGNQGYTPFFDSLVSKSLVFDRAFANGKNSVDAIPAVLASLPSLMKSSYLFSSYSGNKLTSLPNILKTVGYSTAFFHGGLNGSMDFDAFSKMAGFDAYYGRTEYNNDADYDGHWGIYDEPFLQFTLQKINAMPQPFLGSVFTLSSHYPYQVPDHLKGRFRKGPLKIQEAIGYADFALKRFFEEAAKQPWYENTLFVLVADHTPEPETDEYQSSVGIYEIPILFYRPNGELKEHRQEIFQQIDILPTVLDLLNYPKEYFAFGESAFDKREDRFAINYLSGIYQMVTADLALHSSGDETLGIFNYRSDPFLKINLADKRPADVARLSEKLQAFIQTYNQALIYNQLQIERTN